KGSHREQPQCDRNQARPPDRGYAPPKITDDRIRYAPERDRSFSQNKRTERTTAGKQIETMVRGGCYRDGKDSFDFAWSRGSNRRSLALSGKMAPQRDCNLRVNGYTAFCNGPVDVNCSPIVTPPSSRFCPWSAPRPPHYAVRGSGEPI